MQPRQQTIERGEAGATAEDAVEAGAQRERPALAGVLLVKFEIGVKIPDRPANPLLRGAVLIREGVQLVHQPFRVNPAQRVPSDIELPGVVAEHDGIAQEPMRLNTSPQRTFGRDPYWIWRYRQRVEAEPVEMRQPRRPVIEPCLRLRHQTRDLRR